MLSADLAHTLSSTARWTAQVFRFPINQLIGHTFKLRKWCALAHADARSYRAWQAPRATLPSR